VGVLFIVGTVAGILSLVFGGAIIDDPDYLLKAAENENQFIVGALCVLIMGFALAMIPVVIFPIFKKVNETLALGYVVFRGGLETVTYIAMVINWLLVLSIGQEYAKAGTQDAAYYQTLGKLLLEVGDWLDPINTIVFPLGALMFYYLWYRSKLIPRWLSGWGLIGAVLTLTGALLGLFGSSAQMILEMPLALNEMVLALWLIIKGFNSSAIASDPV
jgi:hypothetical protein